MGSWWEGISPFSSAEAGSADWWSETPLIGDEIPAYNSDRCLHIHLTAQ